MIQILEVLKNYSEIQDLNQNQFIKLCEEFAPHYSDEVFEYVNLRIHYPKRTIAFLRSILDYYGVKNNLNKYLSAMSEYKYPKMEALYETLLYTDEKQNLDDAIETFEHIAKQLEQIGE